LYDNIAKEDTAVMTENQGILLIAAINAAKAVSGYEDKEALMTALETAEALFAEGTTPTYKQAADALAALNAQLETAVTEGNTIVHKIPGFSSDSFVYEVDYPGVKLGLTGKNGTTTLSATVLTKDGVVATVSKNITLYNSIVQMDVDAYDGNEWDYDVAYYTLGLNVGDSITVDTSNYYHCGHCQGDPDGYHYIGSNHHYCRVCDDCSDGYYDTIAKITWATSDTECVSLSDANSREITVEALAPTKAGEAVEVSVLMETICGKMHSSYFYVTVTE
jgi:hypothetical protein